MSIIHLSDSYKYSHFNQYPEDAKYISSYMVARSDKSYQEILWFGTTYYIKKYLERTFWEDDIMDLYKAAKKHGIPCNLDGFLKLQEKHEGSLPIVIKALPEGSIAAPGEPLMVVENTDPEFPWLVSFVETLLLKIWYPTTVATRSLKVKRVLEKFWRKTSDNQEGVAFAFHNFGDRGSSSVETAKIGGLAHLSAGFLGTDNFNSLYNNRYNPEIVGYSIPATEHSTVTSWGRENEFKMIEQYLESYKTSPIVACVLDSYNIYEAVEFVTSGLKSKIESKDYPIFVIRPDSGDPVDVINDILYIMEKNNVGFTHNSKGFRLFNKYRIIWGDGIDENTIDEILLHATERGYSAENFAFGCGGYLMQDLTRDTLGFAFKASAKSSDGVEWVGFSKDPITDSGKKSLKGRVDSPRFIEIFRDGKALIGPKEDNL